MKSIPEKVLEKYAKLGRLTYRVNDKKYLCNEYTNPEEIIELTLEEVRKNLTKSTEGKNI